MSIIIRSPDPEATPFSFGRGGGGGAATPQRRTPWGPADVVRCSHEVPFDALDDGISATAAALKGYVEDREGIPPVCQILYYVHPEERRPVLLEDDTAVADLPVAVRDGGLFLLKLRLDIYESLKCGGMPVEQLRHRMAADSVAAAGVEAVCGGGNPGDNPSVKATTEKAAKK